MTRLLEQLDAVVGATGLLIGEDVAARPASWLRPEPCRAAAIVRPADSGELAAVMRLCYAAGQNVHPGRRQYRLSLKALPRTRKTYLFLSSA